MLRGIVAHIQKATAGVRARRNVAREQAAGGCHNGRQARQVCVTSMRKQATNSPVVMRRQLEWSYSDRRCCVYSIVNQEAAALVVAVTLDVTC